MKKRIRMGALLTVALSFLFPALILFAIYQWYGMAPTGEKSLLIMDLSDQYVEFYAGLRDLGKDGGILFSWSKALGGNYAGVFAYYLSSPFSFLILLFSRQELPNALLLMNVLKVGCAGVTFTLLLRSRGCEDLRCVFFALMYALMSYTIAYSMCLMWLDGVIWLPIVIWGVERVIQKNKPWVLLCSLAVLLFSNYYTGFMVFLFAFLYFLFECVDQRVNPGAFFKKLGLCAFATLIAAGLCAWLLSPTLFSLLQGRVDASASAALEWFSLDDPKQLLSKLLIGQYDSITYTGLPLIYCGGASFLLCIAFFFQRDIPRRTRFAALGLLILLLASFLLKPLDTLWHGTQAPNWFPFRYAFVFSFFVLDLATRAVARKKLARVWLAALLWLALLALAYWVMPDKENALRLAGMTAGFGAAYAILFLAFRRRLTSIVLALFLLALGCAETYLNGAGLVAGLDRQFGYKTLASYQEFQARLQPLVDAAEARAGGEFYRLEKEYSLERSKNDAIGFGYNGITHYSSAYDRTVNTFLKRLAFAQSWIWSSSYGTTPITDALLGIRFRMAKREICPWYEATAENDGVTLYENPNALSLAYPAPLSVLDTSPLSQGSSLNNQDALLRAITGYEASYLLPVSDIVHTTSANETTYAFVALTRGPIYAYFPQSASSSALSVNGEFIEWHFSGETHCAFYVGSFEAGEQVSLSLYNASAAPNAGLPEVYTLDEAALRADLEQVAMRQLTIVRYDEGGMEGTIDAAQDCALVTSIPYDEGWTVRIDGVRVETHRFAEALLCVELSAGEHVVEFRYEPRGFKIGMTVTALSALTLAVILAILAWRKRRKAVAPSARRQIDEP